MSSCGEFKCDIGSLLFSAIIEEKEKHESLGTANLVKSCLCKAGLPLHGSESLQLHGYFFQYIFLTIKDSDKTHDADWSFSDQNRRTCDLSIHDYFETLICKDLEWIKYFRQIMPYIRLGLAVKITSSLVEFCNQRIASMSHLDIDCILLLTSMVEMMFSIHFDLQSAKQLEQHTVLKGENQCKTEGRCEELNKMCEKLSKSTACSFEFLLQGLKDDSSCEALEKNFSVMKYLIELFALIVLAVNPLESTDQVCFHFHELKCGREHRINNCDSATVDYSDDNANNRSDVKVHGRQIVFNKVKNLASSGEISREEEGNKSIENTDWIESFEKKECIKKSLAATPFELTQKLAEECIRKPQDISTVIDSFNCLLYFFKKDIPVRIFVSVVKFFSRGEDKSQKYFYNNLTSIIEDKSPLQVGKHFINRHYLFSQFEDALCNVTRKKLKGGKHCEDLNQLLDGLAIYPERQLFSRTPVDELLTSGRKLAGLEDLMFVKCAVAERMLRWCELLSVGMKNLDFENWWNNGFYDLVMEYHQWICTEANVRQVLYLLLEISQQKPIVWSYIDKATKLFTQMLSQLPVCVQEKIILSEPFKQKPKEKSTDVECHSNAGSDIPESSVTSMEEHVDLLQDLKCKEEVDKEIRSLFNKLTCSNVHKLVHEVLILCLYSRKSVLTQALYVAVSNKGQVEPIAQLLREMSNICITSHSVSPRQTLLMDCLQKVLLSVAMDEKHEENLAKLLKLLTQDYYQQLDPDRQHHVDGVLASEEVMRVIILPTLDKQLCRGRCPAETVTEDAECVSLPITTVLHCLAGLIQTIPAKKLHDLHSIVLLQVLTSVCVQNWPSGTDIETKQHEKDTRELCSIWLRARACLDGLMDKLNTEVTQNDDHIQWLMQTCCDQGLLSLSLVYPLINQHSDFKMTTVLQSLIEGLDLQSNPCSPVLLTLLQLGQLNDTMCEVVQGVLTVDYTPRISLNKQHLTVILAQILSQSSPSDMSRSCCMLTSILSQSDDLIDSVDYELVSFIDGKTLPRNCAVRCLCIQLLTESLIWLVAVDKNTTPIQMRTAASCYQSACKTLLELNEDSCMITVQEEVLLYCFAQCCSILCVAHEWEVLCQAVHVLSMTLLTDLSTVLKAKGKKSEEVKKMKRKFHVVKKNNEKSVEEKNTSCNGAEISEVVGDEDILAEKKMGEQRLEKQWLNLECFLNLRDSACCIQDETIKRQLINQLKDVWKSLRGH